MAQSLFRFPNYTPPCPSKYSGVTSTIVDNGRNVNGVVVGAVVREDVGSIDVSYSYITAKDWSDLLKQFSSKYGGRFYQRVTFFDQVSNSWTTRTMYVSDRNGGDMFHLDKNGRPIAWLNATLSLIEK